jgi:hypothetical protein
MKIPETSQQTMIEACKVLGGEFALSQRLGKPLSEVVDWLLEKIPIPTFVFLQCVDVVAHGNARQTVTSRLFMDEMRRRNSPR